MYYLSPLQAGNHYRSTWKHGNVSQCCYYIYNKKNIPLQVRNMSTIDGQSSSNHFGCNATFEKTEWTTSKWPHLILSFKTVENWNKSRWSCPKTSYCNINAKHSNILVGRCIQANSTIKLYVVRRNKGSLLWYKYSCNFNKVDLFNFNLATSIYTSDTSLVLTLKFLFEICRVSILSKNKGLIEFRETVKHCW